MGEHGWTEAISLVKVGKAGRAGARTGERWMRGVEKESETQNALRNNADSQTDDNKTKQTLLFVLCAIVS